MIKSIEKLKIMRKQIYNFFDVFEDYDGEGNPEQWHSCTQKKLAIISFALNTNRQSSKYFSNQSKFWFL